MRECLTIRNLLDCILLKSSRGLSIEPGDAIWAKYLGTLLRQPEGGTLIGRCDQGVWLAADHTGDVGPGFSNASFTSSSLELALLLPSVGREGGERALSRGVTPARVLASEECNH